MLAYVFWHWPFPNVEVEAYEQRLAAFQRALAAEGPRGFQRAAVFRLPGAPWLSGEPRGYEDWYLVDGFAALEALNQGAVSAWAGPDHDRAAVLAAGGTAGLYRHYGGDALATAGRFATWFSKPAGVSYADLEARLRPWFEQPGVGVWQRQMTLGPTREFCLRSPARLDLPSDLDALTLEVEQIWPLESGAADR